MNRNIYIFCIYELLFLCQLLSSCLPFQQAFSDKQLTITNYGQDIGLGNKIELQGIWLPFEQEDSFRYVKSQTCGLVFRNDGTVFESQMGGQEFAITRTVNLSYIAIDKGVYSLCGDTITVESRYYDGMAGGLQLERSKLKIIDRQTLMLMSVKNIRKKEEMSLNTTSVLYMFKPLDDIKMVQSKHKKTKWLWKKKQNQYTNNEHILLTVPYPIELNGCYVKTDTTNGIKCIYNDILLFYPDATVIKTHLHSLSPFCLDSLDRHIEYYYNNKFDYRAHSGSFHFDGKKILAEIYEVQPIPDRIRKETCLFSIIDRKHIRLEQCRGILKSASDSIITPSTLYDFYPASCLPLPNTYLKMTLFR